MDIDRVLSSNQVLGIALLLALLAAGYVNRFFLRDAWRDDDRFWRITARSSLVALIALLVWGSTRDNWRQLIGLPYRATKRFASERVEINPPSAEVRTITIVLLSIALVFVAAMIARHIGGYFLQMVLMLSALVLWAPLFVIRQRLDVNLAFGFEGSLTSPLDVIGHLLFVSLAWSFDIAIMGLTFCVLVCGVALPVTFLLDISRLRQPKVTHEAAEFFGSLSRSAQAIRTPSEPIRRSDRGTGALPSRRR